MSVRTILSCVTTIPVLVWKVRWHSAETGSQTNRAVHHYIKLVHCDEAGPIDPVVKDGFKNALPFVDDYLMLMPR